MEILEPLDFLVIQKTLVMKIIRQRYNLEGILVKFLTQVNIKIDMGLKIQAGKKKNIMGLVVLLSLKLTIFKNKIKL